MQPCLISRCNRMHSAAATIVPQPPQPYGCRCCGMSPWYGCLGCIALGILASVMGSAMLAQERYMGSVHACQPHSYIHTRT